MKVSLASTSVHTKSATEAISDLDPNAADVLITSVLTSMVTDIGVVTPTASGLLTYHDGERNKTHTIDGYFVAPKKFEGNDHEQHKISMTYGGHVETCKGGNTFAVPGIYKILDHIYNNYASIPLKVLFEYPISIARNGFFITQTTKDYFIHSLEPLFSWHPESRKTLNSLITDGLDKGTVRFDQLGDTYSHMSINGFNDFYKGNIAQELVETIKEEGGHVTFDDLDQYSLIPDSKFKIDYRDLTLIGHKGPSIGSLMVLNYLNTYLDNPNNIEKQLQDTYLYRKNKLETFYDRQSIVANNIDKLQSSPSTIQVNTSDESNNHFSITFSSGYGSGVQCKRTGMYLNNSLGEIELNPQGFLGETNNDRLISNMSPMIVMNTDQISTIGSPGADRISTAIAQVIFKYMETNNWDAAIRNPRYHVNGDGSVRTEPGVDIRFKDSFVTEEFDMYFGGVCVTGLSSEVFAYGDPRRGEISWKN